MSMYFSDLPYTLLSLEDYARTMNLNPVQFRGAVTAIKNVNECSDVWMEYGYQGSEKVSRQELLLAIAQAEEDIAAAIGYWMAPRWISDEIVDYTKYNVTEYRGRSGYGSQGEVKTVNTNWGYVHYGGQRATTAIAAGTVTRGANIDTTGDTFDDMAVFTITGITFTDMCELQAFFKVYSAIDAVNCRTDPESTGADEYWQIRDIRIKLSGTTATVYVPIWQMLKPQLQRRMNATTIDADVAASYVDTLEFYRVYNDPSAPVQFLWGDPSCDTAACAWSTQAGCMRVVNKRTGIVAVEPGTYVAATNSFTNTNFSVGVEPSKARLWYYAGYSNPYARGCNKMTEFWKRNIAILASTRLNKPVCTCEGFEQQISHWQEDTSMATQARTFIASPEQNPLGTKVGEILVWNSISKTLGLRIGKRIKV